MPLPKAPVIIKEEAKYYFVKSGGSIGILKDWLSRCLEHAILRGMDTFDMAFANKFALSNKSLITILDEAIEGEIALEDANVNEVKALLYRVSTDSLLANGTTRFTAKRCFGSSTNLSKAASIPAGKD